MSSSQPTLACVACGRYTTVEQPYYCDSCFIPVPVYKDGNYLGPELIADSSTLSVREENRATLARELYEDSRMTKQIIEMLGLDHLPKDQQGVALTALAREKMNFLSDDYNMTEAHTLVDLGYALVEESKQGWAIQIAKLRLASIYIRKGLVLEAIELLLDVQKTLQEDDENVDKTDIQKLQIHQLRLLEVEARLALAYRLAGKHQQADEYADTTHHQLLHLFQEMEPTVLSFINQEEKSSRYLEFDTQNVDFPRVDLVFQIAVILVEEAITRGASGTLKLTDLVIDYLLELDNLVDILARISPDDDPSFFAAHLRDYVRLANGVLWYGDLLILNTGVRRRLLIERYYQRVQQWSALLPASYWFVLRPARIIEIFLRAESWMEANIRELMDQWFDSSSEAHKATWHYVFADAYTQVQQFDKAIAHLDVILKETEEYIRYADDELKYLAQRMMASIELESLGILRNTPRLGPVLELPDTYTVNFTHGLAVEFYEVQGSSQVAPFAIYGERLMGLHQVKPDVVQVGNYSHDDPSRFSKATSKSGERMDVVVVESSLDNQQAFLFFEGQIQVTDSENEITPPLLYLSAVSQAVKENLLLNTADGLNELLHLIVDVMAKEATAIVHTLSKGEKLN